MQLCAVPWPWWPVQVPCIRATEAEAGVVAHMGLPCAQLHLLHPQLPWCLAPATMKRSMSTSFQQPNQSTDYGKAILAPDNCTTGEMLSTILQLQQSIYNGTVNKVNIVRYWCMLEVETSGRFVL